MAGAELFVMVHTGDADVQFPLALSPVAIKVVVADTPVPVYSYTTPNVQLPLFFAGGVNE